RIWSDISPQQPGKIAVYHGLARYRHETAIAEILDRTSGAGNARTLIITKHKEFVFDDRAAKGATKLVLLERVHRFATQIVFPAVCIQLFVLQDLECNAVELVGTGF